MVFIGTIDSIIAELHRLMDELGENATVKEAILRERL